PKPFRPLQIGPVWRAERPQKGRYRQFTQCDIDTIGEPGGLAEIELLEATTSALGELGIEPVTVRLNDRRLLSAVALESGVEAGEEGRYFVTLDKLDKLGWDGVRAELSARGFEPSVGERCEHLVGLLKAAEDPGEMLERAADLLPSLEEGVLEGLRTTARGLEALRAAGSEASFELDPTVVRGMGYYTGQIFEVIHPDSAGSIAGGGRYDKLIARSLGRDVPACGISIGFERVIDLATVRSPDLGLALLHRDDEAADVLTAVARDLRGRERAVTLVPRSASMRAQLEGLATAGYSSFAVLEEGSVSPERDLARKKEPD
ncbi:MAG: ATP phosphoribosyltransferase regulatory subunit, partial [Acidimicrobiales bacterium]